MIFQYNIGPLVFLKLMICTDMKRITIETRHVYKDSSGVQDLIQKKIQEINPVSFFKFYEV